MAPTRRTSALALLAVAICSSVVHAALTATTLPTRLASVEAALASATSKNTLLADLAAWVAIPSISALPAHAPDVEAAAAWIAAHMKGLGLGNVTTLRQGPASPAVLGEWLGAGGGAPTVLIYGHGDVQPADAEAETWTSPPFTATVRDGAVYGRGASDDKGGALGALAAIGAWIKAGGGPPVNVKVYIEFQEEIGSPDMGGFLRQHGHLLGADLALSADGSQPGPEVGAVVAGLRGAAAFEVRVRTLAGDVHSGSFGGSVANAAHALAAVIAGLHDARGRVAMKGFYDGVAKPSRTDLAAIAAYEGSPFFDGPGELASLGATAPVGEAGFSTLARRWVRPTCDVVGSWSGFTGDGIKTIVPAAGVAKVACRLVPGQAPDAILRLARAHVQRLSLPGVALEVVPLSFKATPYRLPPASPAAAAARAVLATLVASPDRVFTNWMGGSIPATAHFKAALGLDTALLAFGLPTDRVHAPDEHHPLSQLGKAGLAYARVLAELAEPGVLAREARTGGADKAEL